MTSRVVRLLGIVALSLFVLPSAVVAQGQLHPRWEIRGFDFRKDGVWRVRAKAVRSMRARLLSQGAFGALNAPLAGAPYGGPQPSAAAA